MRFRAMLLLLCLFTFVRASAEDESEADANDNEAASGNENDKNIKTGDSNESMGSDSLKNANSGINKSSFGYGIENRRRPNPVPKGPAVVDRRSGLLLATVRRIKSLSPCKRQFLLNCNRLLRSPNIRLQFYRDLFQRLQSELIPTQCGEGDESVKLGFRERAVLLNDPCFRAKVEHLMKRQPIGLAIRGPKANPKMLY